MAHTAFGEDAHNRPLTANSKAEFYGAEYEPKIEALPLSVSLFSGGLAGSVAMPGGSIFATALKVRSEHFLLYSYFIVSSSSLCNYYCPNFFFPPFRQTTSPPYYIIIDNASGQSILLNISGFYIHSRFLCFILFVVSPPQVPAFTELPRPMTSIAAEGAALFGLRFMVYDQVRWGLFGRFQRDSRLPGWSLDVASGAAAGLVEGSIVSAASIFRERSTSLRSTDSSGRAVSDGADSFLISRAQIRRVAATIAQRSGAVGAAMSVYTLSLDALGSDTNLKPESPRAGNTHDAPLFARATAGAAAGAAAAAIAGVANPGEVATAAAAQEGEGVSAGAKTAVRRWSVRAVQCMKGPALAASMVMWAVACSLHGILQPTFEHAREGMASAAERRRLRSQLHDLRQQ